jgi:putative membrane protein
MMGWYGNGSMMGWFGGVGMLLLIVAVIVGVLLIARMAQPSAPRASADPADELLRRRYAAGEISRAEFDEARRVLGLTESRAPDVL